MKQIYTKTGDAGTTSLRDGVRVNKDDIRIEANGEIDMLNSLIGLMAEGDQLLTDIQQELMTVMSHVATPDGKQNPRQLHCDELTTRMEQAIDASKTPDGFVLPRGIAHVARAQCRTAERRLWTVHRQHPLDESILRMINRLSDYLFVCALETTR
jgi:ATP:cob(I)alamin adenosyltransferase